MSNKFQIGDLVDEHPIVGIREVRFTDQSGTIEEKIVFTEHFERIVFTDEVGEYVNNPLRFFAERAGNKGGDR